MLYTGTFREFDLEFKVEFGRLQNFRSRNVLCTGIFRLRNFSKSKYVHVEYISTLEI